MSIAPGWTKWSYIKAKEELNELSAGKRKNYGKIRQNGYVWVPPYHTASGVKFGYWRKET